MSGKLKSCPMCGSKKIAVRNADLDLVGICCIEWVRVECKCGCKGPRRKTEVGAETVWNRRSVAKES